MNNIKLVYRNEYLPGIHKIGTSFMMLILGLTFLPALYLSFFKGFHPGWDTLIKAMLTMIGIEAMIWFLEPIMYFPLLGTTGSYIAFVTGNVSNVRIPSSIAAQNALQTEKGSEKAEMAGVYGMLSSVFVNFFFLFIVVFSGIYILEVLPQAVVDSFVYVLPSIFGAILVSFVSNIIPKKK